MGLNFTAANRLTSAASHALPTTISCYAWVKGASVAIGRIFDWNDTIILWRDGGNTGFLFYRGWTGGAQWSLLDATTGITLANWNHVGVTYNGGSTANDPIFYVNGVAYPTPTEDQTPTGSIITGTVPNLIGNSAGTNRAYAGSIGYLGIHDVILSAGEMRDAYLTGFASRSLFVACPLWGIATTEPDYSGSKRGFTVTSAPTIVANPPVQAGLILPSLMAA